MQIFGVRHLSPAAAWHLRHYLDRTQPKAVLIEAPSDFSPLIPELTADGVVPPIAMLGYTRRAPVQTVLYPLAVYSPEYQALCWARENGAEVRFVDLPSCHQVAMRDSGEQLSDDDEADDEQCDDVVDDQAGDEEAEPDDIDDECVDVDLQQRAHQMLAERAGAPDYETWWERSMEQNLDLDGYRQAMFELGQGLRELVPADTSMAENLVRESYMRREAQRCMRELSIDSGELVLVVGAFHAANLNLDEDGLSDEELQSLPCDETHTTLMPYNYFRLSSQSGYGAGNLAPAYFELMWQQRRATGSLRQLPSDYLARVARAQREHGSPRSTAEVIEGVRLATALACLDDAELPTLHDLRDAAGVVLGRGSRAAIAESLARVEIGTRVGRLPDGARQTSIQLDFNEKLKTLKLARFRSPVNESLKLDLRENRRVGEASAFLDLQRSFFLHRLRLLGIGFARVDSQRDNPLWVERWQLSWQPENEIELVEAVFLGDTIEQAAQLAFATELDACEHVEHAAGLIDCACHCGMPQALQAARDRLQSIAAETRDFVSIARAAHGLGRTIRYGDVRNLRLLALRPLLVDLYHQGVIQLAGACQVDADAARELTSAMADLHATLDDHHQLLDEAPWLDGVADVALRDDINSFVSGFASAILLERNHMDEATFERQISQRLSLGADADVAAHWFEGLVTRNRQALLSRLSVWRHLVAYVAALDEHDFKRALVFLRRALGQFSVADKRHIAENLGEIWQRNKSQLSAELDKPLSADEQSALNDLQDMDFDDL